MTIPINLMPQTVQIPAYSSQQMMPMTAIPMQLPQQPQLVMAPSQMYQQNQMPGIITQTVPPNMQLVPQGGYPRVETINYVDNSKVSEIHYLN
jgi:hypothetical protein